MSFNQKREGGMTQGPVRAVYNMGDIRRGYEPEMGYPDTYCPCSTRRRSFYYEIDVR